MSLRTKYFLAFGFFSAVATLIGFEIYFYRAAHISYATEIVSCICVDKHYTPDRSHMVIENIMDSKGHFTPITRWVYVPEEFKTYFHVLDGRSFASYRESTYNAFQVNDQATASLENKKWDGVVYTFNLEWVTPVVLVEPLKGQK